MTKQTTFLNLFCSRTAIFAGVGYILTFYFLFNLSLIWSVLLSVLIVSIILLVASRMTL